MAEPRAAHARDDLGMVMLALADDRRRVLAARLEDRRTPRFNARV
jgi:hypothetical protein